jgi:hypothetical protein
MANNLLMDPEFLKKLFGQGAMDQQEPLGYDPSPMGNQLPQMAPQPQQQQPYFAPEMVSPDPPKGVWDTLINRTPNPTFETSHPGLNNFLTAIMEGFNAKVNPNVYRAQKQLQMHQMEMADKTRQQQQAQLLQLLKMQQGAQKDAENRDWDVKKLQTDAAMRGFKEVSPYVGETPRPSTLFDALGMPSIASEAIGSISLPKDTFPIGDKYYTQAEDKSGITVTPESHVGKAFKRVYGYDLPSGFSLTKALEMPFINEGFKLLDEDTHSQALGERLKSTHEAFKTWVNKLPAPSIVKEAFLNHMENAATVDARSKVTTQTDQVWTQARKELEKYDPEFKKHETEAEKAKHEIDMEYAVKTAVAKTRAEFATNKDLGEKNVDPEIVKGHLQQLVNSGGDSQVLGAILRLYPRDKDPTNQAYRTAIAHGAAQMGLNINRISNRALEAGQLSAANLEHVDQLERWLDTKEFKDKLGPVIGRWNEIMTNKIGAGDPQFNMLRAYSKMINSAVALIHMGQRGAGSTQGLEYFNQIAGAGRMDLETFKAGVKTLKDWMKTYRSMISADSPLLSMGRNKSHINYDAASNSYSYNPTAEDTEDSKGNKTLPPLVFNIPGRK